MRFKIFLFGNVNSIHSKDTGTQNMSHGLVEACISFVLCSFLVHDEMQFLILGSCHLMLVGMQCEVSTCVEIRQCVWHLDSLRASLGA